MNARYDARHAIDMARLDAEQLTNSELIQIVLKSQDNPFVNLRIEVCKEIIRERQANERTEDA